MKQIHRQGVSSEYRQSGTPFPYHRAESGDKREADAQQPQAQQDDDFEDVFNLAELFDDVADSLGSDPDDDDDFQMDERMKRSAPRKQTQ